MQFSTTLALIVMCCSLRNNVNSLSPRDLSSSILASLRTPTLSNPSSLNLETDFYDASTGLHSEGVWHNCLAGIASLQLDQIEQAKLIATSLYEHSWDGTSFRRRAWSGNWNHDTLDDSSESSAPHQANYYKDSNEHRCVQHGIALTFWSMLARRSDCDAALLFQHKTIAKAFSQEFWDASTKRWTTVSQSQGGGSILRPSASAAKATIGATGEVPYYRAVDQAIAVLACVEHIKTLALFQEGRDDSQMDDEKRQYEMLATSTCQFLLNASGFGYENFPAATTYIGLERNRNFWHDGWVLLALISAPKFLSPIDSNAVMPAWEGLIQKYGHCSSSGGADSTFDGTLWHWDPRFKDDAFNVRYCGDNALAYAIQRKLVHQPIEDDAGFSELLDQLLDGSRGLAAVADVYPQVRLHPNTELAALLVWP
jgi:hypothetical protein